MRPTLAGHLLVARACPATRHRCLARFAGHPLCGGKARASMEQVMSSPQARGAARADTSRASTVDMKLEVVAIPVADVDRAKRFYADLGWRLDADFIVGDAFRGVQFTPPGSPCSIHFGLGITTAKPGSAHGLYLAVSDIEAARADLIDR